MNQNIRIVAPGKNGALLDETGYPLVPPHGWSFLPAGDAGITRKVTAKGNYWRVQEQRGRKIMVKGIWAPTSIIISAKEQTELQRNSESHQKQLVQARLRREKKQTAYEEEFYRAVRSFLRFHNNHHIIEHTLALLVTSHAIPVGSGTVARTQTIPIGERAAKAVVAWLRHKTTGYDNMTIAHVKGERRKVRRQLAQSSLSLLAQYRCAEPVSPTCPIYRALKPQIIATQSSGSSNIS